MQKQDPKRATVPAGQGRAETRAAARVGTAVLAESTNPKDRLGRMKPPLHLIPPAATIIESLAMEDGARKYGPYNWRTKTVAATVYVAACMRHLQAWLDGEENARDSGHHHLGHARASLGIILDAQASGTLVDDRPTPGAAADLLEMFTRNQDDQSRTITLIDPTGKEPDREVTVGRFVGGTVPRDEAGFLGTAEMGRALESAAARDGAEDPGPRKRRVYIAGPMRGYPKFNFPAFDAARDLALNMGYDPISPADLDRENGIHEDTVIPPEQEAERTREFVRRDIDALLSLRAENGDAIALLPGWARSTGALAEFWVARWLGLKVLDALTMEPFGVGGAEIAVTPDCMWYSDAREYILRR